MGRWIGVFRYMDGQVVGGWVSGYVKDEWQSKRKVSGWVV